MSPLRAALSALLAAGALACAGPSPAPFAALAVESRLLAGDVPEDATIVRGVEVRAVTHVVFWVPTDGEPRTLERAVGEVLDRGRGDLLVNATVQRIAWYVPLLYGEYGWLVRGDVVRLRDRRPHRFDVVPEDAEEDAADEPQLPQPAPHDRPGEAPPNS